MIPRPLICTVLLLAACGDHRHEVESPELKKRAAVVAQTQIALRADLVATALNSLEADLTAGREARLDILMLSGGGSWGAFGAGYLHGWSSLPADQPLAMPRFDLVSGVSTGALLSPYALIGTPEYLARVEQVYRSCSEEWAVMRPLVELVGAASLCDTKLLDSTLRGQMDAGLAREVLRIQEVEHRQAIVASSDIDLGRAVLWRLGDQARKGLAASAYDPDFLFKALRSSAAIPGAFSPVEVDGSLHVDGALYGQIHVLADMRVVDGLLTAWREKAGAAAPLPKIRYWVILNNRLNVEHKTIQPNWSDNAMRSIELMLSAQVAAPLNRLALFVEGMRLKHGLDVELRWVQIPSEWTMPPGVTDFHPSVTNSLADLGLTMGADPASWSGPEKLGLVEQDAAASPAPPKP